MASKTAISAKDMRGLKVTNAGDPTAAQDLVTKTYADTQSTNDRSRANHTGTQLSATISDLTATIRTNRLDQMAAPTASVAFGGQKITGLADGTANTDAVTLQQLNAAVAGIAAGLAWKGALKVVTTTNVNLAAPGASLDGKAMTVGDVFFAAGQTTGSQGGPYVWNGAAVAATRAPNWDAAAEAVPGSLWVVQTGTYDNQLAILSNDSFVLGTDTPVLTFINPAAASDNDTGYSEVCPSTAAGAAWAVNHGLNSKLVLVQVFRSASPFDEVDVTVTRDTVNQVNVKPDVALAAGEYTVVVGKVV
jgi:hypothetical protein